MNSQFEIDYNAIEAQVDAYKAIIRPYEEVKCQNIAEAFVKFQKLVQEGQELFTNDKGVVPTQFAPAFGVAGFGQFYIRRSQESIDAELDAYRERLITAETARLQAARVAHIEAQVAAAVAEHQAEQARKAQAATDKVAEKARAAAIAALGEVA